MSLQVWLPLRGNLNNQGLNGSISYDDSVTYDNNGKIGKCLKTTSVFSLKYNGEIINTGSISFGGWFKINKAEAKAVLEAYSYTDTRTTPTGSLIGNNSYGGIALTWYGNNMYSNGGVLNNITVIGTLRSSTNGAKATGGNNFSFDTWHHLFLTFNKNTRELKFYMDGILGGSSVMSDFSDAPSRNLGIGYSGVYGGNGPGFSIPLYTNDIRIYDHCLSPKEVEELSKGLILHYKLDDPYIEDTTILSCSITDTAYNGSTGKYGYNVDSNLIKTTGVFQGKNCVKIGTRTDGVSVNPYVYFSNLFTSNGTNSPEYKTLTFDYYTTVTTTTWLNIYKLGSGSGTATWRTTNSEGVFTGTYTNSSSSIKVTPNTWNHIEVTLHGTTDADAQWGYCINGTTYTSSENNYFLYANIQLEQKDHATGYGANFHQTTIYDSSGYGNDGTIEGTLETCPDSPHYQNFTLSAGTGKIIFPKPDACNDNIFSFSCWSKKLEHVVASKVCTITLNDNLYFNFGAQGSGSSSQFFTFFNQAKYVGISPSVPLNEWHHWVGTWDGTTANLYRDGVLKNTLTTQTNYSTSYWSTGALFSGGAKEQISDFRIYATALTESQVKELYNTSASIDNQGNIHAREVVEL